MRDHKKILQTLGFLMFLFWLTFIACWAIDIDNGYIDYGNGHKENIFGGQNSRVEVLNDDKDWTVKYNPLADNEDGEFTIQERETMLRYNYFEDSFEYDSGKRF